MVRGGAATTGSGVVAHASPHIPARQSEAKPGTARESEDCPCLGDDDGRCNEPGREAESPKVAKLHE
jgi:hypothetical protein